VTPLWALTSAATPEIVDKVHDRRLKVSEVAEAVGVSDEQNFHILGEE
jgi:hypothetical protein